MDNTLCIPASISTLVCLVALEATFPTLLPWVFIDGEAVPMRMHGEAIVTFPGRPALHQLQLSRITKKVYGT